MTYSCACSTNLIRTLLVSSFRAPVCWEIRSRRQDNVDRIMPDNQQCMRPDSPMCGVTGTGLEKNRAATAVTSRRRSQNWVHGSVFPLLPNLQYLVTSLWLSIVISLASAVSSSSCRGALCRMQPHGCFFGPSATYGMWDVGFKKTIQRLSP